MTICTINIDRLRKFEIIRQRYSGFEIGEQVAIPEDEVGDLLLGNLVTITGFNTEYKIIHWQAPSIFGGMCHSGSFIKFCKKL